MRRPDLRLAPRALGYLVLGAGALMAAVALQDVAVAALALAPVAALVVGLASDAAAVEASVVCEVRLDEPVSVAGEPVKARILLSADRPVHHCKVSLALPEGTRPRTRPHWLCSLGAGETVEVSLPLSRLTAGETALGPVVVVTSGLGEMLSRRFLVPPVRWEIRPNEERVRTLERSSRVRAAVGDRLSREQAEGIELAEVRPEMPGDRGLRLNWRATARRGTPHVTTRHPEKSTDVAVFADTFDELALPRVLEVTAAVTVAYLRGRDRLGFVSFGGVLGWVEAASGRRQLDRVRARLAATSPFFSYAWKTIERIPARALPSGALVLAVSPLRDERFLTALADMRGRGHEVVVVETSPLPRPMQAGDAPTLQAASRLLRMEREDLRHRLWERGIAVAPLAPGEALEPALANLRRARRHLRRGARR